MKQRKYYKGVPELERQDLQDRFNEIQCLWKHLSRGANTGRFCAFELGALVLQQLRALCPLFLKPAAQVYRTWARGSKSLIKTKP